MECVTLDERVQCMRHATRATQSLYMPIIRNADPFPYTTWIYIESLTWSCHGSWHFHFDRPFPFSLRVFHMENGDAIHGGFGLETVYRIRVQGHAHFTRFEFVNK